MNTTRYETLSEKDRVSLVRLLEEGFHEQAACELFDEGIVEERDSGTCENPAAGSDLRFIPSALRDWHYFGTSNGKRRLRAALSLLPQELNSFSCVRLPRRNARLLRDGLFRIVFRVEDTLQRPVILGIAVRSCNPMLKIWRYLDQRKAKDLIRSRELYFRRSDLLEDEYEATPSLGSYLDELAVRRRVLPSVSGSEPTSSETHKHCTYVCCWRMSPHESWPAWKNYCPHGGGFAIQTTWRKLTHLHHRLREEKNVNFRTVAYINHRLDDFQNPGLGEEAFYKSLWFSDEREIRLVCFHDEHFHLTREDLKTNPARVPRCDRIECDLSALVARIVINPFATEAKQVSLKKLIAERQPCLLPKIWSSEIAKPAVGAPR